VLPKKNRLKRRKNFERLIKKGSFYKGVFLVLKTIKNEKENTRFGFIVSKKVSKKAVERNKVKRRMREVVRGLLGFVVPGYDVVFFAKKNILGKNFNEIKKEICALMEKSELIKKT